MCILNLKDSLTKTTEAINCEYSHVATHFLTSPYSADHTLRILRCFFREGTGDVYFATSSSAIQRARYDATKSTLWDVTTVIAGHVQVHVEGYNLGASIDDIVFFSVRGVECLTIRRESSNSLRCVFGDERVTSDLGEVRGVLLC